MPHVTGHSVHGDGWGNTKPKAPPGQNPYGSHTGYGNTNNSTNITSATGNKNKSSTSSESGKWAKYGVDNSENNWNKSNKNNSSADNSNSNSDVYNNYPDQTTDETYNETIYSNQQNVSNTIDQWQLDNDKTNTFFTGGGTLINSKDKDTQDLYTAGIDILNVLGLANTKSNMQIALNILQGGDRIWGKTTRALENANPTQLNAIAGIKGVDAQNLGKTGLWNTWGTNIRGDATWGNKPLSQEEYQDRMVAFSGNWEAGSPMYKYQRMLIDGWQTMNPNYRSSGSNKLGAALVTSFLPMAPKFLGGMIFGSKGVETLKGNLSKPTNLKEVMANPLGAIIPEGWISDPKEGIKSLYINGQEVTINSKTINRNDGAGGIFSKYDLMEADLGKDSGTSSSAPYYNSSYNIENGQGITKPVTIVDDDDDTGESENTMTANDNPAWWNFKLFETIFSPLSALKYKEGDVVENTDENIASDMVRNIIAQAKTDNQAKAILKNLIEENEQIANVVNTYEDIKQSVNDLIGPIEISADVEDLTIQAETPKGFIAKADLQDKELSVEKQLGNLNLTASYNPEKESGFLGLQKAF